MPVRKQLQDPFQGPSEDNPFSDRQKKFSKVAASAAAQRSAAGKTSRAPEAAPTPQSAPASQAAPVSKREAAARSVAPSRATSDRGSQTGSTASASEPSRSFRMGHSGSAVAFFDFVTKNRSYILSAIVVILVVALGIVLLAPLLDGEMSDEQAEERYVSPYDWASLQRNEGRFAYAVGGEVRSRLGIDVSENQHWIDWDAVKSDGIDFAMIRLGYRGATAGDLYMDEYFEYNIQAASDAGIDRGVYFFSQAQTPEEAREEADFVLEHLKGAELQYPIAFDTEEKVLGISQTRTYGLDDDQMTAIADAFCERIEQAGYDTIIYGNHNDISRFKRSSLEKYGVWWAEYGVPIPHAKIDFIMWQYANTGTVAGIDGEVDMNIDLSNVFNE